MNERAIDDFRANKLQHYIDIVQRESDKQKILDAINECKHKIEKYHKEVKRYNTLIKFEKDKLKELVNG